MFACPAIPARPLPERGRVDLPVLARLHQPIRDSVELAELDPQLAVPLHRPHAFDALRLPLGERHVLAARILDHQFQRVAGELAVAFDAVEAPRLGLGERHGLDVREVAVVHHSEAGIHAGVDRTNRSDLGLRLHADLRISYVLRHAITTHERGALRRHVDMPSLPSIRMK